MSPRADEASLLSAAALFEEACGLAGKVPIDPIHPHPNPLPSRERGTEGA